MSKFSHKGVRVSVPALGTNPFVQQIYGLMDKYEGVYWPHQEDVGASEAHGIATVSGNFDANINGATSGQETGFPGIGRAYLFDGNDAVEIFCSGAINNVFDGSQGTWLMVFNASSSSLWTDDTQDYYLGRLRCDSPNYIRVYKPKQLNNNVRCQYRLQHAAVHPAGTTYHLLAMTWDANAGPNGELISYLNGVPEETVYDIGTWVGELADTYTALGAMSVSGSLGWEGHIAHMVLLGDAATPDEMKKLWNALHGTGAGNPLPLPETVMSAASEAGQIAFVDAQNKVHVMGVSWRPDTLGPANAIDFNLDAMQANIITLQSGRCGWRTTVYDAGTDCVYIGGSGTMQVRVYDVATGEMDSLCIRTEEISVYKMAAPVGDTIAWTTYPHGNIQTWDTDTETLTEYGVPDPDVENRNAYGYTVVIDPTEDYIYIALRPLADGQNPVDDWWLVVLDRTTKQHTTYFKNGTNDAGSVHLDASGNCYYKKTTSSVVTWYSLIEGVVTECSEPTTYDPIAYSVVLNEVGYTVDLDHLYYIDGETPYVRWHDGDVNWHTVQAVGTLLTDATTLFRLSSLSSDLLIASIGYGPIQRYDPSGDSSTLVTGKPDPSIYGLLELSTGDIWVHGYASYNRIFDPDVAWSSTNPPWLPGLDFAKYHRWGVVYSGNVYILGKYLREQVGGVLAKCTEAGSVVATNDNNDNWRPRGLAVVNGKIVCSLYLTDGDGVLLVFDPSDITSIERTITPFVGSKEPGAICTGSGSNVVGFKGEVGYCYDISTGSEIWRKTLPGETWQGFTYWYDHKPVSDASYAYLPIGGNIYKVDLATGTCTLLSTSQNFNVFIHDGELYLYGGSVLKRL